MPLIAITECHKIDDYKHAVTHANAEMRIVNHTTGVADALQGAHGILLTGGSDIDPHLYGETPHQKLGKVERRRDDFEIALTRAAREKGLPILAICRGLQVLNVACGGTLIQDIPSDLPNAERHQFSPPEYPANYAAHDVWVDGDSLLARLMRESLVDGDTLKVNSRHHQAVKALAPGFKSVATAPDGVIEAIEDPSLAFCLGVQWHPENFQHTGEFRALFEGLVQAGQRL